MAKAIDWDFEISETLDALFEEKKSTAFKRELPEIDTVIYWIYGENDNEKVTMTWTDDFGGVLVWAAGEIPGEKIVKDFLRGA